MKAIRTISMTMVAAVAALSIGTSAEAAGCNKPYTKVAGISGKLSSVGSDTMNNLMALWGESFSKIYPGASIQVEGKGSSTAPPALMEGVSQLGPMSRKMKNKEMDAFEKKVGFKATRIRTSQDALAIFVNKENPIKGLTFAQADAIFGKSRKHGYAENITTWGQLGLKGTWANKPITIFGRNSASGTYGFFKKKVLKKGDYKNEVKEQPGSASVVQGVTENMYAIGYSGVGYKTSGVRTVPLAKKAEKGFYDALPKNISNGKYPLGRFLNLYIAKDPSKPLRPVVREFIKFIFSSEGQAIVKKDGYMPVETKTCNEDLNKLL